MQQLLLQGLQETNILTWLFLKCLAGARAREYHLLSEDLNTS